MPDATTAPAASRATKNTRVSHHRYAGTPAFPAQWLYGLYALSPECRYSIHTCLSLRVVPYLMRRKASRPIRITFGPGFP
jgi:hypothetical protein